MQAPETFGAILMDPPWPELGGKNRGADSKYPVIRKREQIRDVILGSGVFRPAQNAHLYMWVTNNFLTWGVLLFEELGFTYKTNFPWVKSGNPGLGQYGKGAHELLIVGDNSETFDVPEEDEGFLDEETSLLLFGTIGKGLQAATTTRSIRTDYLVGAPSEKAVGGLRKHSAKPPRQYDLIKTRSKGPYLEMFARTKRPGFWSWGNEITKVD